MVREVKKIPEEQVSGSTIGRCRNMELLPKWKLQESDAANPEINFVFKKKMSGSRGESEGRSGKKMKEMGRMGKAEEK